MGEINLSDFESCAVYAWCLGRHPCCPKHIAPSTRSSTHGFCSSLHVGPIRDCSTMAHHYSDLQFIFMEISFGI